MYTDTPIETMQELERVEKSIEDLTKYRERLKRRLKWQQEFEEKYHLSALKDFYGNDDKSIFDYMNDFINETHRLEREKGGCYIYPE